MTDRAYTERIESTREERDAAYVGGPPASTGPIVIAEYDPSWPAVFTREEKRIRTVLGATVISVTHVGSTSVPGLAAKPIVDIDLIVASSADEDSYLPALTAAGYELRVREPNWHEHRMFRGAEPPVNLHVFSPGSPETVRHIVFRDWLRTHPDDRDRYADVKRTIATRESDVRAYTDAKDEIIDDIYARAFQTP